MNALESFFTPNLVEAGLDEAGRGCIAGPVVAAAVILPKQFDLPGMNDSKQLTATQREHLRAEIERQALAFSVCFVDNGTIDKINILKASFKAMHECVDGLSLRPELLLVDGNRFPAYMGIPHQCIVKGDAKFASIAAASILAKTYRDEYMTRLAAEYPDYGWDVNMGYPTPAHKRVTLALGHTSYHRLSFKIKPPKDLVEV